jgi:ribosomal-protein-alanine N-acetyltransferase
MDYHKRFAWLRFGLGEERGKGYAHEALSLLAHKLFSSNCHRIEAEVYDFNARSLALLERLGFKREGVKREAHHDSDGYHDVIVLGLLRG